MSNYSVEPANKPQALTKEAIKALRHEQVQGVSRRELLRGSLAAAMGLWLVEVTAGTIADQLYEEARSCGVLGGKPRILRTKSIRSRFWGCPGSRNGVVPGSGASCMSL